jgi:hypothetical protein
MFMAKVRMILLDSDWELQTRAQLIGLKMANRDSFDKFHTSFIALSLLLVNTTHALNISLICHQLETAMCPDLAFIYGHDEAVHTMPTMITLQLAAWVKAWVKVVVRIDDKHRHNATTALHCWAEMDKENTKHKAREDGNQDSGSKHQNKSTTPTSSNASGLKPASSLSQGHKSAQLHSPLLNVRSWRAMKAASSTDPSTPHTALGTA